MVHSTTTPAEFDMWKNVDVPRSNVPPSRSICWPRAYYIRSSWTGRCTSQLEASGGQEQYYVRPSWHLHCTDKSYIAIGNLTYSNLSNLCRLICVLLLDRKQRADNPPRNTYHGSKWHKSPMQSYINIWHYFQWLLTVVYLYDLIIYSSTKCMQMLWGLFPIQTN